MPHAVSMASTGLQAIILCGPGSSFPTFTSNPDESPKALLPIANRPMVWYPIDFCYRSGITNITLICPSSASKAISTGLNTNLYLTALPLPRPDVLAPADLDYNMGTADILRLPEVKQLITQDFVVLPCDLVCEVGGSKLLQAWQYKSASLDEAVDASNFLDDEPYKQHSGGMGVWYNTKVDTPIKKEETDFIATTPLPPSTKQAARDSLVPHVSKLVYSMPKDTFKEKMEEQHGLAVRHGLIRSHPRVRMLTTHRDAHIYVFPKWILEFIEKNERLETISEDVVGWWAKAGWQNGLAQKLLIKEICRPRQSEEESQGSSPTSESSPAGQQALPEKSLPADNPSEWPAGAGEISDAEVPQMLAYVHPGASQKLGSLIRRVDTAQLLLAISLQLAKLPSLEEDSSDSASPYAHSKKVAYPEGVKSRTTITKADSLVGENVSVEEKVAIKESVVGAGCQLNEGAKLAGCLLMEGVVVGKNCKLTKCILGKRCVIGDGSILENCEVQENLMVEAKTEDKDNKLMSSEGLEATEAEMEEVLQEQEDQAAEDEKAMAD